MTGTESERARRADTILLEVVDELGLAPDVDLLEPLGVRVATDPVALLGVMVSVSSRWDGFRLPDQIDLGMVTPTDLAHYIATSSLDRRPAAVVSRPDGGVRS